MKSLMLMALAVGLLASPAMAQSIEGSAALVGGRSTYTVKAGDTIGTIGALSAAAPGRRRPGHSPSSARRPIPYGTCRCRFNARWRNRASP
jgi:hypothetical protein